MQQCKDNANDSQFILPEMKNNIKQIAMEQVLYAQVVKLRRKDLKVFSADKKKKQSYKDTIYIDIDNISKSEKKNKVNIIKWRPIYEVIDEAYFIDSKFFSDDFMQQCKDNANDAQFIPFEMKNNMKLLAMVQGLYAQVIILYQKHLKCFAQAYT